MTRWIEDSLFTYGPLRAALRRSESTLDRGDAGMDTMERLDPAHMPLMRVVSRAATPNLHASSSSASVELEYQLEVASGDDKLDMLGRLLELAMQAIARNSSHRKPRFVKLIEMTDVRLMNTKEFEETKSPMGWVALATMKVLVYLTRDVRRA